MTLAETNSRPTTQHKGERKNILDLSVEVNHINNHWSRDPNLVDLDTSINEQKIVGAIESKFLNEKRNKRMELL